MTALIIFWTSAALIAYAYVGYPALLWCRTCIFAETCEQAAYRTVRLGGPCDKE